MIQSLSIRNFQIHRKLQIDLDFPVTTIIGSSDTGKSAILRALRWLCLNRPSSTAFTSHQAEFVRVRLLVDGRAIVRQRGKKNSYKLDGKEFIAFGTGVPPEIVDLLNLSEENFQGQHDSPFWFALTPGQVSKELNRIVNLDAIDKTLGRAASELRRAKTIADVTRDRVRVTRGQRNELSWTKQAERELRKLEGLAATLAKKRLASQSLGFLLQDHTKYGMAMKNAKEGADRGRRAVLAGEGLAKLVGERNALQKLIREYDCHRLTQVGSNYQLKEAEQELKQQMKGKCPLCQQSLKSSP